MGLVHRLSALASNSIIGLCVAHVHSSFVRFCPTLGKSGGSKSAGGALWPLHEVKDLSDKRQSKESEIPNLFLGTIPYAAKNSFVFNLPKMSRQDDLVLREAVVAAKFVRG